MATQTRFPISLLLGRRSPSSGRRTWKNGQPRHGYRPRGIRWCENTPTGSTGWPTGCPATRTMPRTSPRKRSSGCSAAWVLQAGTFEGWLHRITTNLFLDMVRRRSRLRMEGLPEDTDRLVSDGPSPEQVYVATHLDPDLQRALDDLVPEFRAAVVLCDVEGLSYEEIGATLGVKLGTVRSRIHRGRQALKAALEKRRADAE